jgi:hypothetical protein
MQVIRTVKQIPIASLNCWTLLAQHAAKHTDLDDPTVLDKANMGISRKIAQLVLSAQTLKSRSKKYK